MDERTLDIIQLANKMFEQYGIRSVSVDDICRELRLSKKTFYRIFPGKEDLVESVVAYRAEMITEKFQDMWQNENAIDTLILIIKEVKKHTKNDNSTFYYDLEKYYPTILAKLNEKKLEWVRDSFAQNLRQGIEEGYYREDLDVELTSLFHAVVLKSSFAEFKSHLPKISVRRLNIFYIDLIIRLIANEKGMEYIRLNIEK